MDRRSRSVVKISDNFGKKKKKSTDLTPTWGGIFSLNIFVIPTYRGKHLNSNNANKMYSNLGQIMLLSKAFQMCQAPEIKNIKQM